MLEGQELRRIVEAHFRVYEERDESLDGGGPARLFFVMFPAHDFNRRFEAVREAVCARDPEALVFARHDGGEDVLVVTERPPAPPTRVRLHAVLFLLTVITTVTAGAFLWSIYHMEGPMVSWTEAWRDAMAPANLPANLLWGGLMFAFPLMLVLGIHEAAHYVAARRHGLRASLPFFIPFPPVLFPIGTLGAFIRLRDPLPDRRALFDVGASGPAAGFAVALPVLVLGIYLTGSVAMPVMDAGRPEIEVPPGVEVLFEGRGQAEVVLPGPGSHTFEAVAPAHHLDPWRYTATARFEAEGGWVEEQVFSAHLVPGEAKRHWVRVPDNATVAVVVLEWDDGVFDLGRPLLAWGLEAVGFGGGDHLSHPLYLAGWVGMLVTGINLLPAGQLDGGHVARAVLGDRMRFLSVASVALLVFLALNYQLMVWALFAMIILFMGLHHPPALNERTELGPRRRFLAAMVLVLFALTFIPQPIVL